MRETPERVAGSCYCGEVRVEIEPPAKFVCHCHCENCRRAHGAGFVTWVGVPAERFRVVDGEDQLRRFETEVRSTRSFCSRCGTTLLFEGERWPGEVHVAAANLDRLPEAPSAHAYADRAPDWCPILDELKRYGGESGTEPL